MAVELLWELLAVIGLMAEELGAGKLFWRVIDWIDRKRQHGKTTDEACDAQHEKKETM